MNAEITPTNLNWGTALKQPRFVMEFFLSLFTLITTMLCFSKFTAFVESRVGLQIPDPILKSLPTIDLTFPIFILVYGGIVFAVVLLYSKPFLLTKLLQAYALMVMIRMVMMYALPLSPPEGMILLRDPFVELFGEGKPLTQDLFFSGHTATLTLVTLASPKRFKLFCTLATIILAICVLLQKVHYSVDVLVAPLVSFFAYTLVWKFKNAKTHPRS